MRTWWYSIPVVAALGLPGAADARAAEGGAAGTAGASAGLEDRTEWKKFGPFKTKEKALKKCHELEERGWHCDDPYFDKKKKGWFFKALPPDDR